MSIEAVLSGEKRWHVEQADAIAFLDGLPADSVDLVFFSPPYERARTYGIKFDLAGQAWVDWLVKVFLSAGRVCRGLVGCVCEGQTKGFRWSAVPALLMADLHRAGVNLRRPAFFHRVGIPGSGGPDWLRADVEFIVCASGAGKLPWSDNTAAGHKPKWAPGGAMSHRLSDGQRVNQWGAHENGMPREQRACKRRGDNASLSYRRVTRGHKNGDAVADDAYLPPVKANPGNLIHLKVGGGLMGSALAHDNEAPFPEALAAFFVRSFCPPGGLVVDCFAGSGTTGAVSVRHGRRFIGCDIRQSQVELSRRRIGAETPDMFETATGAL